jgi:hypothetical protein
MLEDCVDSHYQHQAIQVLRLRTDMLEDCVDSHHQATTVVPVWLYQRPTCTHRYLLNIDIKFLIDSDNSETTTKKKFYLHKY